MGKKVMGSNLA